MPEGTRHKEEIGFVEEVKHYLVYLRGLPSARVNDIVVDDAGRRGIVHAVREDAIEVLMLDQSSLYPGVRMWLDKQRATLPVGDFMFGAVLDGLGKVVHRPRRPAGPAGAARPAERSEMDLELEVKAEGIDSREFITEQLVTGFSAIDLLIPVGKGQRELVFGSRDSGKIRFLREMIVNQKGRDVVCVYAAIGKPASFTPQLLRELKQGGALEHTVVLSALSTNAAPIISIAPSVAFLVAEHFAGQGRDVVLVLDDLGVHAQYLREIALLSGRVPGRESYPGDIFYQHAHLMERSGRFNESAGGGSITLFPVMETSQDNFTNLIPTNLMASTDGHLLFSADRQTEGIMPAVSVADSVTRVGHHSQSQLQRELSTELTNIISEYPRQQEYSRFGTTLSNRTKRILTQGRLISVILNQEWIGPLEVPIQIIICALTLTSMAEDEAADQNARVYREDILNIIREHQDFAQAREKAAPDSEISLQDFLEVMEAGLPTITALWQTSKTSKTN